uniref:Uncharacterized protein n=1 Tax=Setaria viridis TaxID=4556 RepID=A0A4U6UHU1_SETVI|nr:hypothetical protein SEVIR_6G099200v2 [Setaria viridis]
MHTLLDPPPCACSAAVRLPHPLSSARSRPPPRCRPPAPTAVALLPSPPSLAVPRSDHHLSAPRRPPAPSAQSLAPLPAPSEQPPPFFHSPRPSRRPRPAPSARPDRAPSFAHPVARPSR